MKKKNKVFEYLSKSDSEFNEDCFKKIVYSKEGFESIYNDFDDYKYSENIRKQMITNLKSCNDSNLIHHLIFYTERNDPQNIKSIFLANIAVILSGVGVVFGMMNDLVQNKYYSIFLIFIFYIFLFFTMRKSSSISKISTYSYLNSLCQQALSESKFLEDKEIIEVERKAAFNFCQLLENLKEWVQIK